MYLCDHQAKDFVLHIGLSWITNELLCGCEADVHQIEITVIEKMAELKTVRWLASLTHKYEIQGSVPAVILFHENLLLHVIVKVPDTLTGPTRNDFGTKQFSWTDHVS